MATTKKLSEQEEKQLASAKRVYEKYMDDPDENKRKIAIKAKATIDALEGGETPKKKASA